MIVRVALKLGDNIFIGKQNARHDSLYTKEVLNIIRNQPEDGLQGFIDNEGNFLDRHEAGTHAFKFGQVNEDVILVSEDLW